MAITTTFRCDRCGREHPTPEQFWHLAVSLWHHGRTPLNPSNEAINKVDLCRECVEDFGLVPRAPERRDQPVAAPTVEDLLRQMIAMCMPEAQ